MAVKSENLNSDSILRLYKQNLMLRFMEIKSNEPRLTKKNCNQLGYSDSTIKRYRDDISEDSPYKRSKYRKKKVNQIQQLYNHKFIQHMKHLKIKKILKKMKRMI